MTVSPSNSENIDLLYIEEAEKVLSVLFRHYVKADEADKFLLEPIISKAADELLKARLSLFKSGILIREDDLEKMQELKNNIDQAADFQAILLVALRLAATLGAFA